MKKKKKIDKEIRKGITITQIKDAYSAGTNDIRKAKIELLKPLIKDEDILNLMITPENFKKIQHRIDYNIKIKNEKDETLAKTFAHGKDIHQTITELRETIQKGELIKYEYIKIELENKGYKGLRIEQEGRSHKIQIIITFRKAK